MSTEIKLKLTKDMSHEAVHSTIKMLRDMNVNREIRIVGTSLSTFLMVNPRVSGSEELCFIVKGQHGTDFSVSPVEWEQELEYYMASLRAVLDTPKGGNSK